jgi:hypothetical protein
MADAFADMRALYFETLVKENGEEDTWKKNPWEVI